MVDDTLDIRRLVADHHQAVFRYAFRLCGGEADAEDLTQQTFLTAQQSLSQLRSAESARPWLFAILRNCFLRNCRKPRPIPAASLELDVDAIPAEVPAAVLIDRAQLQQALDRLPEHYRIVLAMFYYEDLSYRQIAEGLELPIGTVMSRLARAKEALRGLLAQAVQIADPSVSEVSSRPAKSGG